MGDKFDVAEFLQLVIGFNGTPDLPCEFWKDHMDVVVYCILVSIFFVILEISVSCISSRCCKLDVLLWKWDLLVLSVLCFLK